MSHPLAGVHAAAVTPLTADGLPDLEALPALMDFLCRRGCHGILLLGTTGEGPSFSAGERLEILRRGLQVRAAHPACRLLAGTGTPSLTETADLTRAAFDLGYDAVVVLPPFYYRKASDDGLFAYFRELIRIAVPSDGALLGYHFPGVAGIGFSLQLLARLKDVFGRQFAGLKDSSHEAELARSLGARFGADLLVLTGTDSLLLLALENHAGGCITAPANLISPELRAVWDAHQRGEEPSALQARVSAARQLLEGYPPFPPLLKGLLARVHGFPRWPVRPPLTEVGEALLERVQMELASIP